MVNGCFVSIKSVIHTKCREETGVIRFEIKLVCVYSVIGKTRVNETGKESFGLLCYAEISEFSGKLDSEMEKVILMDELPTDWTYPLIQPSLIEEFERRDCLHRMEK